MCSHHVSAINLENGRSFSKLCNGKNGRTLRQPVVNVEVQLKDNNLTSLNTKTCICFILILKIMSSTSNTSTKTLNVNNELDRYYFIRYYFIMLKFTP